MVQNESTYRWRLIASDVANDSPAPSNLFRQRHRQRLNVSPATSPATRQLLPATSPATNQQSPATLPAINKRSPATLPAINQQLPATSPAIKKGSPAINKRSPATLPATQQVIASNTRRRWQYCWRLRVLLATLLAIRDVAGNSAGNTGRRWQHEASLATSLAT